MSYVIKTKKPVHTDFDLIIIGSGSGGGVAAHLVAHKGKKVAIIEAENIGGECPNYGCVPTKALLQAAETYRTIQHAADFGIKTNGVQVDMKALQAWRKKAVRNTGTSEGIATFEAEGITVLKGRAHFIDPWTIAVNERHYTAHQFLIATGTHDLVPAIPGLKEFGFIGYRQALELEAFPKKLCIIGGGAIGCEFAHYFSTFGVRVEIMEFAPRLLAKEDAEVGELIEAVFEQDGIVVHTDAKVLMVEQKGKQKIVSYEQFGRVHKIIVDEIMLAAGKVPNTDLGLENAGVSYDRKRGIEVDAYMQTNVPHIYAAGDVVGGYMFTHVASFQSRIAALNMLSPLKHAMDYRAVPRCVFVAPECASVGATEEELKAKGIKYQVAMIPTSIIGRANTTGQDTGFVKIIANKKGYILGGCIVAPRAGEMIQELVLAVQWKLRASKIDFAMHAYPTWSQAVRICASKIHCR